MLDYISRQAIWHHKAIRVSFSYCMSFEEGCKTQMHTHEYLELAYIVSDIHQRVRGKDIGLLQGELCLIDKNCKSGLS